MYTDHVGEHYYRPNNKVHTLVVTIDVCNVSFWIQHLKLFVVHYRSAPTKHKHNGTLRNLTPSRIVAVNCTVYMISVQSYKRKRPGCRLWEETGASRGNPHGHGKHNQSPDCLATVLATSHPKMYLYGL